MVDEFPIADMGPDDDGPNVDFDSIFIPKQTQSLEITDEVKNEIALIYNIGTRKISNFMDVLENPDKMEMIIEDLLPETGLTYFAGQSGTGKTILAIQVVANLVLGRPTMTWKIADSHKGKRFRVLMLSLEMNGKQLQRRLEHMYPKLEEEEKKLFRENFLVYSEAESFELWNPAHMLELIRIIKECEIDILLIDSASVSFGEELNNQVQVNKSIKNLYRIRASLNVAMFVVAHTRKPPPGIASNPEDATLNELFGHSAVAQSADGIIILMEDEPSRKAVIARQKKGEEDAAEKTEKIVHIVNAKSRFGSNSGAFKTHLTSKVGVDKGEPLMFRRNAWAIEMTDEARRDINKTLAKEQDNIFAGVDLGSLLGLEDD